MFVFCYIDEVLLLKALDIHFNFINMHGREYDWVRKWVHSGELGKMLEKFVRSVEPLVSGTRSLVDDILRLPAHPVGNISGKGGPKNG